MAFGIISLLPVELILQVGTSAGFAMVFALLIAAIIWNLGTWWLGLPASSSHTLIGSIIGVGVANALMHGRDGTSGVDWAQATKIGWSLLISPVVGFVCAALLLLVLKALVKNPALYQEPKGNAAPPWWIRGLLILTCGGVSFAHGSNDGQKGMGLIMLILIGTVPMAYALNRAMPPGADGAVHRHGEHAPSARWRSTPRRPCRRTRAPRSQPTCARTRWNDEPGSGAGGRHRQYRRPGARARGFAHMPATAVTNVRNDMYLTSEAIRFIAKDPHSKAFDAETTSNLSAFKKQIDHATKFIPLWVKVASPSPWV